MKKKYSLTRRGFIKLTFLQASSLLTALFCLNWTKNLWALTTPSKVVHSAENALAALIKGNEAYVKSLSDQNEISTLRDKTCQQLLKNKVTHQKSDFINNRYEQNPRAIIIGCSDSRVSPEIVFDQGIGDLFVIRLAGNLIDGSGHPITGSIEYAVSHLNVRLIIILGHQKCGAIHAALEKILNPLSISSKEMINKNSHDVIEPLEELITVIKNHLNKNEIENALITMAQTPNNKGKALDHLMDIAIKRNITSGVDYLTKHEKFMPYLKSKGNEQLIIKSAIYSFESGKVNFI